MAGHRSRRRGELEEEVVRALWSAPDDLSVSQLQSVIGEPTPAYTTLLTVLGRLEKKGRVISTGESPRRSRFRAAESEDAHVGAAMTEALSKSTDRHATLLRFVGNLDDDDARTLRAALDKD